MVGRQNRISWAFGVVCALLVLSARAGDLEDGIRAHQNKQYAAALKSFQAAATAENGEAQRRLGFMYYHGEGVRQDGQRAIVLFEGAAKAGDVASALNLGKMYEFGMGVAQDDARALYWYQRGAELDDAEAQFNTSVMYYKGRGAAQNRIEAAKWWTLAMMKSGGKAEIIRLSVESAEAKMTADEVAEGRRRATEWAASAKNIHN